MILGNLSPGPENVMASSFPVRIGVVTTEWAGPPDQLSSCFKVVTENGRVTLGTWRAIGMQGARVVFRRVS